MSRALLVLLCAASTARAQTPQAAPAFTTAGAFVAHSVPNLEAATRWYRDKLGLRVVMQPPPHQGVQAVVLEGGGLIVELIHNPAAQPLRMVAPAITHTTLVHGIFKAGVIVENLDATLTTLRERGVEIAIGPFPAREGQRANFIIKDGDGNFIQFFGK